MRISTGESADRELRPVRSTRDEIARSAAARAASGTDRFDAAPLLSRSIARSQAVVAGLRQMQDALERGEAPDVAALVEAVRFEGEAVLAPHRQELAVIADARDGARLGRLLQNTESNVLALLAQTGVRHPDALLSAAADLRSISAVLGRTVAAIDHYAGEITTLRPERVADLLT